MTSKKIIALTLGVFLGSTSYILAASPIENELATDAATEDAAIGNVGMPNPMLSYDSYADMEQVLGFKPLIFPKSSGLVENARYVIGDTTADIRYKSRYGLNGREESFLLRTARGDFAPEAISGLYGYNWEDKTISHTRVKIAKINDSAYAAVWISGGFSFAAYGQEINYWNFIATVQDNLVDLTEHYY